MGRPPPPYSGNARKKTFFSVDVLPKGTCHFWFLNWANFSEKKFRKNLGHKNTLFSTFRDSIIPRGNGYCIYCTLSWLPHITSNHYSNYTHTSLKNDVWILAFYTSLMLRKVGKEKPIWSGLAFVTISCLPYLPNMTIKMTLQHQSRSLLQMRRKLRSLQTQWKVALFSLK